MTPSRAASPISHEDACTNNDPALKERIATLKGGRDQAKADAERASAMLDSASQQAITPAMLRKFALTARERIRLPGGGYRRDHLRALA